MSLTTQFYIFVYGRAELNNATKFLYNLSAELVFGDPVFCFEPELSATAPGPTSANNRSQIDERKQLEFSFLG